MKIDINPSKELFKWGPIEFRQIYSSGLFDVILVNIKKNYKWPWPPSLSFQKDGKILWVSGKEALCKTGLKYFKKYFLNLKEYNNHWKRYEKWIEDYETIAKGLDKINFQKLTEKELNNLLSEFINLILNFWLIVHVPEIANWGGEYLLRKELEKISKENADKYLEILTASVKLSFFQKEELDLLKCQSNEINKHASNYRWILNSYGGNRILTPGYFRKKRKELTKDKIPKEKIKEIQGIIRKHKARKKALIKRLKLKKETILIFEQLSQAIWWQDHRKSYIWRTNYYWDKFLKEIGKRRGWKIEELQHCGHDEIKEVAKGKKIDKKAFLKRKNHYIFYSKGDKIVFNDNEKTIKKLYSIYGDEETKGIKKLKGLTVSKGKRETLEGKVTIISNPFKEGKKMKEGNILVAGMTSPEFIIVMKKAKAIITDYGRMTSHAAIVSRELNIPCIVNTRIGSKVLKDGDLVRMNVSKGVIEIIKEAGS